MKIFIQILFLSLVLSAGISGLHAQNSGNAGLDSSLTELLRHKPLYIEVHSATQKTQSTPAGYHFEVGQKVKLGKGTGTNGKFNFIRLYSKRPYRYSEESENKSLNSINPAGPELSGVELVIHKILFGQGRRKAPDEYWLINIPSGGLFRIEIEMEPALKSGELLPPR